MKMKRRLFSIESEPFVRAVVESPEDDAPRLVYADWCEERGMTDLAEFIRVQCSLARLDSADDSPVRDALEAADLRHAGRIARWWLPKGLRDRAIEWRFRRGFVEEVVVSEVCCINHLAKVRAQAPLRRVELRSSGLLRLNSQIPDPSSVSGRPSASITSPLRGIPELDMGALSFNGDDRRNGTALLAIGTKRLGLSGHQAVGASSFLAATGGPMAFDLGKHEAADVTALGQLARSPLAGRIESLRIDANHSKIADLPLSAFGKLVELHLERVDLRQFARRTSPLDAVAARIARIDLRASSVAPQAFNQFINLNVFDRLGRATFHHLESRPFTSGIEIWDARPLPHLRELEITDNQFRDGDLARLAASGFAPGLRSLQLRSQALRDPLQALIDTPWAQTLRHLSIAGPRLPAEAIQRAGQAGLLEKLVALDLELDEGPSQAGGWLDERGPWPALGRLTLRTVDDECWKRLRAGFGTMLRRRWDD